jgi:hypothetical protein
MPFSPLRIWGEKLTTLPGSQFSLLFQKTIPQYSLELLLFLSWEQIMEDLHQAWNERHKVLRELLTSQPDPASYLPVFLEHHAYVHPRCADTAIERTFEEDVWEGLSDEQAKQIPEGMEHSIAWCLWHLSRIEDAVMHVLVANEEQLLDSGGWDKQPGFGWRTTGNEQTLAEVAELSRAIDIHTLKAYRLAVSEDTRRIVGGLTPEQLSRKPTPSAIEKLYEIGAVVRACPEVADYWAGLTTTGLLLMPATRHPLLHLNESERIKAKVEKIKE